MSDATAPEPEPESSQPGSHQGDLPAPVRGQRLSRAFRALVVAAIDEARGRNASLVEAEHLLLALTADPGSPVGPVLRHAGLDRERVEAALRAERAAGLRAAGVEPVPEERLAASPRVGRPRWGTSAREVLVRAHRISLLRGRAAATTPSDVLAALAGLELGTVPRALELAGIDRSALAEAARAA
ncbi:Clp protease N-terminal domain-containing protein [Leifsonia sp. F6_8S_P_1B]|uniref:Clp protease N-terminal domain-containing protein n=1 Tax=Leifsonia williamsii TaxID=3035919 RepID=A0ABT8KGI7_9MICO|nr:Clp protease N-terminal domain-containing protein [Leifsonia williamsii]MDN4615886.1 Clp protease N-terminal domain-containing protein [Leifsonia williamsii]